MTLKLIFMIVRYLVAPSVTTKGENITWAGQVRDFDLFYTHAAYIHIPTDIWWILLF